MNRKNLILSLIISLNSTLYSMEDDYDVKKQAFSVLGIDNMAERTKAKNNLSEASKSFYQENLIKPVKDFPPNIKESYFNFLQGKNPNELTTKEKKNLDDLKSTLTQTNEDKKTSYLDILKKKDQNQNNEKAQENLEDNKGILDFKNLDKVQTKEVRIVGEKEDWKANRGTKNFKELALSDIIKRKQQNEEIQKQHQYELDKIQALANQSKNESIKKDLEQAQLDLQNINSQMKKIKETITSIESNDGKIRETRGNIEVKMAVLARIGNQYEGLLEANENYVSKNLQDINGFDNKYEAALGRLNIISKQDLDSIFLTTDTSKLEYLLNKVYDNLSTKLLNAEQSKDQNSKKDVIYIVKKIIDELSKSKINTALASLDESLRKKIEELEKQQEQLEKEEIDLKKSQEDLTRKINDIRSQLEQKN